MNNLLKDTGERMVPEFHKGSLMHAEHLTRYETAEKLAKKKVVLDIACGSGYGTKILARSARKVYGVDIDKDTIKYAQQKFDAPNIEYKVGDGIKIPLEDNSIELVVTFETIEHIKNYSQFINEIKRVLKPDGLVIVSTPNDIEFAEGNHFHIHEFTFDELMKLLKKDFKFIDPYFQATWKYVAVGSEDILRHGKIIDIRTLQLAPLNPKKYLYFYLLCSNRKIVEKVEPLAALGGHYSDRDIIGYQTKTSEKINELKDINEGITQNLRDIEVQKQTLQHELQTIKSSRSYILSRRLSRLLSFIKPTQRSK